MQIETFNVIIPLWVIIALVLIIPAWLLSRWGQKRGFLKFLMIWSFANFACLSAYIIFSRNPFAIFGVFHALAFGLLSLIFIWLWKKKKKKIVY
jgi:hypothetical protein